MWIKMVRLTFPIVGMVLLVSLTGSARMVVDGSIDDWVNVRNSAKDNLDMKDISGDIKLIQATVYRVWAPSRGKYDPYLYLRMSVYGNIFGLADELSQRRIILDEGLRQTLDRRERIKQEEVKKTPDDKYYYYWLIDADNNPKTGINNSFYKGKKTKVKRSIGVETVVMIGWKGDFDRNAYVGVYGKPGGNLSNLTNPRQMEPFGRAQLVSCAPPPTVMYAAKGDTLEARIPLQALGLTRGRTVRISAFQGSTSDNRMFDWAESVELKLVSLPGSKIIDWLWMTVPTPPLGGAPALKSDRDWLAEVSGGTMTEKGVAVSGVHQGQIAGKLKWTQGILDPTGNNNVNNLINKIGLGKGDNDNTIAYAVTRVIARHGRTRLYTGSSDAIQVWLNGEVCYRREMEVNSGADDYQESREITLKQGENILMVATYERSSDWSMFVGFDSDIYTVIVTPVEPLNKRITTLGHIKNH